MDEEPAFTADDCLRLFGREAEAGRWQAAADSAEYLAIVLWLVDRDERDEGPHAA